MKVDILVPCYNPNNWLFEAIESIRSQTHHVWHLFLVLDGNNDAKGIFDKCRKKYINDKRIEFIKLKNNRGPSMVRNIMLLKGDGEYLTFMDQDDKRNSRMFTECVSFLHSNTEFDMVHTDLIAINSEGREIKDRFKYENERRKFLFSKDYSKEEMSNALFDDLLIRMGSFFVTRKSFLDIGGFPHITDGSEEILFFNKFSSKYNIGYIPKFHYIRRLHESNLVKTSSNQREIGKLKALMFLSRNSEIRRQILSKSYANRLRSVIFYYNREGNYSKSIQLCMYLLSVDKFNLKSYIVFFFTLLHLNLDFAELLNKLSEK